MPALTLRRQLLLQERVQSGLSDGLIDFRLGTTGGDRAHGLAINLDGQSSLRRKEIWKRKRGWASRLEGIRAIFRGTTVESGVTRLLLRPFFGVDRDAIALFQKEQRTILIDNADGDRDVLTLGLGLCACNHRLHRSKIQIFLRGQI